MRFPLCSIELPDGCLAFLSLWRCHPASLRRTTLVDLLRRFPCVTTDKAARLKGFVSNWSSLKPAERSPRETQLVSRYKLEKLAYEWGLEEDVSKQMQDVLAFQTRHYAATQGVETGYSEPVPVG